MGEIRIPLAVPDVGEAEIAAVSRVLTRRWLTMGEETAAFEREFAALTGTPEAIAVANCTTALHLCLVVLGVGAGDEVLVPSLSFVATANAVRYCGATPVFVDVPSANDLNFSVSDARAKITPRTKGLLAVHYGGYAADLAGLRRLADERGLFLLEDAAQAAGASRDGQRCGAVGEAACFSFYSTKNATTGEGGMITTHDAVLAERLRLLRSHGMTASVLERDRGDRFGYDVVALGYNYRIDELRAAIGREQIKRLAANNARRRALTVHYTRTLEAACEVEIPFAGTSDEAACHLLAVLLPASADREAVAKAMRARGVQTSVHYRPIHLMTDYRDVMGTGLGLVPVTEAVAARELTLPLYAQMTEGDVEEVVVALAQALGA